MQKLHGGKPARPPTRILNGARIPTVMWAQRNDVVFLTINLEDVKNPTIALTDSKLTFSGIGGTDHKLYEISLEFAKEVNPQESKYAVQARNVTFMIKKKASGPYWPHLLKDVKKAFWLKTDFNKWKEEESDDEMDKNMDLSGMMQSMGSMGSNSGPPAATDLPDEEEDSDEDLPGLE